MGVKEVRRLLFIGSSYEHPVTIDAFGRRWRLMACRSTGIFQKPQALMAGLDPVNDLNTDKDLPQSLIEANMDIKYLLK